MYKKIGQSFASAIFFEVAIVIILTVGILGYIWIDKEYETFNQQSEKLRMDYISNQKNIIKNEVNRTVEYIQYMKSKTEEILRKDIRSRTYEAYYTAMNIYNQNKGTRSEEEIKKLITDALRPIRFNDGRGYYFIDTLEGDVILYPILPESEGTNLIDLKDDNGNFVLREEIELVKKQNEGYITGHWIKPDSEDKQPYKKITFVKRFEPFNWYMGSGEYVDDVMEDIQAEILQRVSVIRFGYDNDMCVFINNYDGVVLADAVNTMSLGQNIIDQTDERGKKVIQEQIQIVQKDSDGGFLSQYCKMSGAGETYEKMTFVRGIPEWEWVVGSGVQMDKIEQVIASNRAQMQRKVQRDILNIILLLLGVLVLAFALTRYLTDKSRKNLDIFLSFLKNASRDYAEISIGKVHYSEFKDLAAAANAMIFERNVVEERIRKLNEELEGRIQVRTREIEELNANLEKKVEERTQELNQMLIIDGLTRIYNHKYMYERLEEEIIKASARDEKFCVIMFDLDHFKSVNDLYGHPCGDRVLVAVAETIRNSIRKEDVAGRYGGEEFIVLLPDTVMETGYVIAERIRKEIMALRFEGKELSITISGGIVEYESESAVELVRKADEKMYEAKQLGRNRVQK